MFLMTDIFAIPLWTSTILCLGIQMVLWRNYVMSYDGKQIENQKYYMLSRLTLQRTLKAHESEASNQFRVIECSLWTLFAFIQLKMSILIPHFVSIMSTVLDKYCIQKKVPYSVTVLGLYSQG